MKNLTCIVCPIGCDLDVDDSSGLNKLSISGNKCKRGADYAREEIQAPKRVVTATMPIIENQIGCITASLKRVPVKSISPCLREKIPALLEDIYKVKVSLPVKIGDVLIENWNGEGIDIIATRTIG